MWNKTFNSINVGSATVVNDLVLTATFDGTIYGFRITTGEQLFTYKAPAGINGWPEVAGDIDRSILSFLEPLEDSSKLFLLICLRVSEP